MDSELPGELPRQATHHEHARTPLQRDQEEDEGGRGLPQRDEREHLGHRGSSKEQQGMGSPTLSHDGRSQGRNTKTHNIRDIDQGQQYCVEFL
jgi:hypothetical protein